VSTRQAEPKAAARASPFGGWRGWFTSTGAPPAWALVRYLTAGLIVGAALSGGPTGDVAGWAGHRLLDTMLGCAIALVATYLLWPRDREAPETVPVAAPT
jgi:uncharacterized membrane protein YccC